MGNFLKYVLATIVGIIVTTILFVVFGLMSIVGMLASSEATTTVHDNSVLVINLNGVIAEQAQENLLGRLTGGEINQLGLNDILSAIKKAKTNDDIKGIYIEAGALSTGYASLLEIRNALLDFKESKKWVWAYGDIYTQGAYYVASAADKVYLNPIGQVDIHGISSQQMYLKDLYAKFGINYQIVKVGKYKSATEVYSEDHMSDANREQLTAYITGLWNNVTKAIADGRKLTAEQINDYADEFTAVKAPEELKAAKLIDGLLYADEMKAEVKKKLGLKEKDIINQLSVADMRNVKEAKAKGGNIAVYYAEGEIVDAPVAGLTGMGTTQIVGEKMCRDIDDLADDEDIKAVVLRVNSPGGSAYASEQIWHHVSKLKAKKPVVVSMGDYAASGGYYISCNASCIVAQPTTLTGSIGIFGVIPEASDLLKNKLSLHFDEVNTNKHSNYGASVLSFAVRPFTAEERDLMQAHINRGYDTFLTRVSDGRKISKTDLANIAEGRVWLGSDALKIKLVDELGGIGVAIKKAATLAQLDDFYTTEYPAQPSTLDQLLGEVSGNGNYLDERMKLVLGDWYMPFVAFKASATQCGMRAEMPFHMVIK